MYLFLLVLAEISNYPYTCFVALAVFCVLNCPVGRATVLRSGMSCSPSLRLLPGGEARRAAAAVWRRDLPGEAACRDCPSEWPVAAVATRRLGRDHAFFGGCPAEQPVTAAARLSGPSMLLPGG